jgi:hypothetical protein
MSRALQITAKMPSDATIQVMPVTTAEGGLADGAALSAALHPAQAAGQRDENAKKCPLENAQQKRRSWIAARVRCRYSPARRLASS